LVASEFGPAVPLIVAHRRSRLPEDDSLTLAQADLAPSAVLREEPRESALREEPELPAVRHERFGATPPRGRAFAMIKRAVALINPWANGEGDEEGWWEYRANPELAAQVRRAARLLRRGA
jgi:hypothetical protein